MYEPRILIVDDNKNNLFTLRNLIEEHFRAQLFEADSGLLALRILTKEPIDLIILDVQMPEMDGFETAKTIHSWKKTQHIPIVFLTAAYKAQEFFQQGFAVGAVDYLTKPIDAAQLINRIHSYVRFLQKEHQHKQELEQKIEERTAELSKIRHELEHRVAERTAELVLAKTKAEQAQQIAEAANTAKTQFLANMSHELRTPLNAIIGYSEMLQEDALDRGADDMVADLQKIHASGKHLLQIVSNVLDLSKIEAGKMELALSTFNLTTLVDEVVETIRPLMIKRENTFKVTCTETLGEMYSDEAKLRHILLNLLSNATKFTECGLIHFEVERHKRHDDEWVTFRIIDNGIGIPPESQVKLFQPFTQADASTTRRYGGTGIGLSITKQFTEMMGGIISVSSEFGRGSTFTISLPLQFKEYVESASFQLPLKGEGIILVIDDDVAVSYFLKDELSKLGYAVAMVTDEFEAIKLAYKLRPDAILLDVQMAGSWRILSKLKNEALLSHVPVIVIGMEEDKNKGSVAEATDCITKPIERRQLVAILDKYHVGDNSVNLVMIVDDEPEAREALSVLLEINGWRVFQAENGQVAFDHLDDKKPTLILLDLNMPVMNGFEFITLLRRNKNERWRTLPVVVLTARDLSADEQEFLNSHVETTFSKTGYQSEELVMYIHELISEASAVRDMHAEDTRERLRHDYLNLLTEELKSRKLR